MDPQITLTLSEEPSEQVNVITPTTNSSSSIRLENKFIEIKVDIYAQQKVVYIKIYMM